MHGHRARVSSLAWNNHVLSSGGLTLTLTLSLTLALTLTPTLARCSHRGAATRWSSTTTCAWRSIASVPSRATRRRCAIPHPTHNHVPDPNPNPNPEQVCGLRWSPWGTQLASGGNDNLLNVWDDRCLPSQHTTTLTLTLTLT